VAGVEASRVTVTVTVVFGAIVIVDGFSDSQPTSDGGPHWLKPGSTSTFFTGLKPPVEPPTLKNPQALPPRYSVLLELGSGLHARVPGSYAKPWLVTPAGDTPPETSSMPFAAVYPDAHSVIGRSVMGDQVSMVGLYT